MDFYTQKLFKRDTACPRRRKIPLGQNRNVEFDALSWILGFQAMFPLEIRNGLGKIKVLVTAPVEQVKDEDRRQHLEFIQNVITRMNSNSFQIKQIAVLIVTALLAVYATNKNDLFIFIGALPTLACWFMDAYYLKMERQFRGLYDDVIGVTNVQSVPPYGMDIKPYRLCYCDVLISPSMWFYPLIAIILIVSGCAVCSMGG